jgi:hypothetical protein
VIRDEEDTEQRGSCQGGGVLDWTAEGGKRESWQVMPQVKELKELKLPVGNEKRRADGRRLKVSLLYLPVFFSSL